MSHCEIVIRTTNDRRAIDALFQRITRRRAMKTHTTMLSSLAIAALATVTLNSTEALAKSAGGGSSGMRSFSAARTPVVVNRIKPVTTPTVKKLTTMAVARERLKPTSTKTDVRCRYCPLPGGGIPLSGDKVMSLGDKISSVGKAVGSSANQPMQVPPSIGGSIGKAVGSSLNQPKGLPPELGKSVGGGLGSSLQQVPKLPPVATPLPGGTSPVITLPPKLPPILTPPPAGTPPVVTLPPKLPTPPILTPPPAGTPPVVTLPPKLPTPGTPPIILPPPVVVTPPAPPVVVTSPAPVSVGYGVVAAPEAVEPCTYERSVRKLPGGGLQRVIAKVCPDVIVT